MGTFQAMYSFFSGHPKSGRDCSSPERQSREVEFPPAGWPGKKDGRFPSLPPSPGPLQNEAINGDVDRLRPPRHQALKSTSVATSAS